MFRDCRNHLEIRQRSVEGGQRGDGANVAGLTVSLMEGLVGGEWCGLAKTTIRSISVGDSGMSGIGSSPDNFHVSSLVILICGSVC